MSLKEILAVLLGWIGLEVEVGTHGANGSLPVSALEARGTLRKGEEFGVDDKSPAVFAFRFEDEAGDEVASLRLSTSRRTSAEVGSTTRRKSLKSAAA